MPVTLSTGVPDDASRRAIRALADRVEEADGAAALSDQARTLLGSADVAQTVARDAEGVVLGYAQRAGDSAEVVGEPAALPALLDAVLAPGVLIWTHGERSRLLAPLAERGLLRVRELLQLRRPLGDGAPLPADPPLPPGVEIRTFEPGRDDAALLAVNAAAFATHPEQGTWTQADLDARVAESWFSAAGVLLAVRGAQLLGFHWTKIHPDGFGEVYVLGVDPATQGTGLGKALLVRGLRLLADEGCPTALLYVDGDNSAAVALYERLGFTRHDLDVQWAVR
ncbi:mycothiol synthase [uncultured Jatrophihabitans sp.]|uniref:mycothiol synthase n=1 Tax=uncultured Jatrophihabitans sp. TaxID=1610747 RepID=UPI0035C98E4F